MGIVYKAFDPYIERPVAIKTIRKDLVEPGARRAVHGAFQERGQGRGPAAASEYRQRLRIRRGREGHLHRDGIRRGCRIARVSQSPRELRLRPARRADGAAARRARVRACARRRPSRHQALEPDRHEPGRAQGRRLRHRARRHVEPDDGRHDDRHAALHVAGADPRAGSRSPVGSLQHRRRPLRAADRREAVRRQSRIGHLQDLPRRARNRRRNARRSSCRSRSTGSSRRRSPRSPTRGFRTRAPFTTRCAKWRGCRCRSTTAAARRWSTSAR